MKISFVSPKKKGTNKKTLHYQLIENNILITNKTKRWHLVKLPNLTFSLSHFPAISFSLLVFFLLVKIPQLFLPLRDCQEEIRFGSSFVQHTFSLLELKLSYSLIFLSKIPGVYVVVPRRRSF